MTTQREINQIMTVVFNDGKNIKVQDFKIVEIRISAVSEFYILSGRVERHYSSDEVIFEDVKFAVNSKRVNDSETVSLPDDPTPCFFSDDDDDEFCPDVVRVFDTSIDKEKIQKVVDSMKRSVS